MDELEPWARYVEALAPAGAVIAAIFAALFAWLAHRRQTISYKDDRFWRRLTWAMERVAADDANDAYVGLSVLEALEDDPQVQPEERSMLDEMVDNVFARIDEGALGKKKRRTWWRRA